MAPLISVVVPLYNEELHPYKEISLYMFSDLSIFGVTKLEVDLSGSLPHGSSMILKNPRFHIDRFVNMEIVAMDTLSIYILTMKHI